MERSRTEKDPASQEEFVIPKELECLICGDLLDNAVSLKACGHTYCSVCIRNHWRPGIHSRREKECPLCNKPAGSDVAKTLIVNRAIQERIKNFKDNCHRSQSSASSFSHHKSNPHELPIQERMQSRNYSRMQKNGKKELQNICRDYNISSVGNEQDLVDRLRQFECMWNAELDTIYTPSTPSELVAKFKKKERLQREQKSRDIMTGTINDSKHVKKLTSLLLNDDGKKRNEKKVSATSSGNGKFDSKFQENFALLIAKGREHMKKKPGCPRRTYEDDHIHDKPEPTSTPYTETAKGAVTDEFSVVDSSHSSLNPQSINHIAHKPFVISERKKGPHDVGLSSRTKIRLLHNPYVKCQANQPSQNQKPVTRKTDERSVTSMHKDLSGNISESPMGNMPVSKQSRQHTSGTIYNPYKKKQKTTLQR